MHPAPDPRWCGGANFAPLGARQRYRPCVSLLMITDDRCLEHEAGPGHPERPDRLRAVWSGVEAARLGDQINTARPTPAPMSAVLRVHDPSVVDLLEQLYVDGGGRIDPDTATGQGSWPAARLAAGSGLDAIEVLEADSHSAVFCAVRPPGHHATPTRSMGFCLLNNVAVAALALAERGERVVIIDYDAHHGNGTQEVFYSDPRVLYVSFHQWPLYPGTGRIDECGSGSGAGTTINIPFPAGTTGDSYRRAWDEVVGPRVGAFEPTWCLVSAGFDGHRNDPLAQLGLSAGDFADLTTEVVAVVPEGRRIVFLEGGYDLDALTECSTGVVRALVGDLVHPEPPTSGGPGADVVDAARAVQRG
jgi:acetoin utilization deacetylase AcuC-like enzyme